jgi:hypothetical protein
MNKQGRQGARTPADLERKYRFGKNMGEAKKAASDASRAADRAVAAASKSVGREEYDQIVAMLNKATAMLTRLVVDSGGFTLDAAGNMSARSIKLGGKDLETRLAAIEAALEIEGGGTDEDVEYEDTADGGTKVVGDEWEFIYKDYANDIRILTISEHLEQFTDAEGSIYLRAVLPGNASCIVHNGFSGMNVLHTFTITE